MRIFPLVLALAAAAPALAAAPETIDAAIVQPPDGWARAEAKNAVSYQKITGATYGQIAFYRARGATGASVEKEFDAEWSELVAKNVAALPAPESRTRPKTDGGVSSLSGTGSYADPAAGKTTMSLHVFVEGGRVSSIRTSTNDTKTFKPALDAFVAGVRFQAPAATVASAAASSPDVTADPARVPGRWRRNISAANTSVTYWDPSYARSVYDFKTDGTYTFSQESWQKITPDDYWFVEETGAWKLEGTALHVIPKTSTRRIKSHEGALKKTEPQALEDVRYEWHFRTFSGIGETDLVLRPPKQTGRDRVFSSNDLEPNSYLYSPDK